MFTGTPDLTRLLPPYLLDAQSDLLSGLDTQMVIPLRSLAYFPDVHLPEDLTPIFRIKGV